MYISKLLFPAMLALKVLAHETEPSDEGAIEAREWTKPPPFVDDDSHNLQDFDSSGMSSLGTLPYPPPNYGRRKYATHTYKSHPLIESLTRAF